jgi:hypothetical protein
MPKILLDTMYFTKGFGGHGGQSYVAHHPTIATHTSHLIFSYDLLATHPTSQKHFYSTFLPHAARQQEGRWLLETNSPFLHSFYQ